MWKILLYIYIHFTRQSLYNVTVEYLFPNFHVEILTDIFVYFICKFPLYPTFKKSQHRTVSVRQGPVHCFNLIISIHGKNPVTICSAQFEHISFWKSLKIPLFWTVTIRCTYFNAPKYLFIMENLFDIFLVNNIWNAVLTRISNLLKTTKSI